MPVPLSTLDTLDTQTETPDIGHVMGKRKRAKAVLWVGFKDGKPVTKLYDNMDNAIDAIPKDSGRVSVKKLHPELDQELINKIRNS